MNNEQQVVVTSPVLSGQAPVSVPFRKNKGTKVLLIVAGVVLLAAAGYGGYSYGIKHAKTSASTTTSNTDAASTAANTSKTTGTSFHTVAFGSVNRSPNLSINLAFPENYQAIAYANGQDSFRSLFGDDSGSANYEAGSWDIGNPDDVDGQSWGNIGIMGIAPDWYNRNGFATYGGFNGDAIASNPMNTTINGYDFSTAKQKKQSLDKLISDTSNCAKDSAKGFAISGGFNVCYNPVMIKQAYAAYDPQVQLSGYASIKGVPYVLFGHVSIRSGLDNYSDAALDKAGNDFRAGKIPSPTQKNIDSFINAFKQSSVISK